MLAVSRRALPKEKSPLVRGAASLRSPRQRPAAPAHGPWSALPAPPAPRPERGAAGGIPAISSAPRGMWPARCPTAERPEVGARRRGQSQPRLAAARASPPTRDSRPAAPRPGRPDRPFLQPRACLAPPGSGSSLRGCRRNRSPLRASAFGLPLCPTVPPRPPRTPASPQNLSLKLKSALATSPWAKSLAFLSLSFFLCEMVTLTLCYLTCAVLG